MDIFKLIFRYAITPSGIISLCFVLSFPLIALEKRVGKYLLVLGIIFYFTFHSSPLSMALLARLEDRYPPLADMNEVGKVDTIVLLTGATWKDLHLPLGGRVGETTVSRLGEVIRLFHLNPEARIVISGGLQDTGARGIPVSGIVGELASVMGIPDDRILLETNSTNTYENGVEIKKILGEKPFLLVTSACHLPLAIAVFQKLGLSPIPVPADFRATRNKPRSISSTAELLKEIISALPGSNNLANSERAFHEYGEAIWYKVRGRI